MQVALNYLILAQKHRISELEHLRHICELMDIIGELVHALQSERGSSNVFLASKGAAFRGEWDQFILYTNAAGERLNSWLKNNESSGGISGGSRLLIQLALAIHLLNDLTSGRERVRRQQVSPFESTGIYSAIINALLDLVFEVADIAVSPSVSKQLVALFFLMRAKEFAGLERATGARICASRSSPELLDALNSIIETQETCIERFRTFSGDEVLAQWEMLIKTMPIFEIEQMRRKLLSSSNFDNSALAIEWFEICTRKINDMRVVEKYLTKNLADTCDFLIQETRAHLSDQNALLASFPSGLLNSPIALLVSSIHSPQTSSDKSMEGMGPALSMEILDVLQHQSQQLRNMNEELLAVRVALDERKIIERAKGVLMAHQGITEEKAYSVMREKAMSQNQKMIEIAQSILSLSEFLNLKH